MHISTGSLERRIRHYVKCAQFNECAKFVVIFQSFEVADELSAFRLIRAHSLLVFI
ncbi:unnamed protein product [Periconia digitata]|uniref:Uncharacterized protein n=1 Tax=Periconia digitata TaxID=1303443 RepID=A0A9W4U4W2_9PLEO|nr:unnamed protein product [Periconia digitata]